MVSIDAVFVIEGERVVPVRAIPYVTGGDIGPLGIAQLLSEPDHRVSAYVRGTAEPAARLLPKEWRQVKLRLQDRLTSGQDVINSETLGVLPASTFVQLCDLWQVYADLYLPPREDLPAYSTAERENFQIQQRANIPVDLVNLIFEGFQADLEVRNLQPAFVASAPNAATDMANKDIGTTSTPVARFAAQEAAILSALQNAGYDPKQLPKNMHGRPGVKAHIRCALGGIDMWSGSTVFDKAWERLRKGGDIADKD